MTLRTALLLLAALLPMTAAASAQTIEKIPEVELERETELDADGRQQWKPLEVECPVCKRRKEMKCQGCDGVPMPECTECDGTKMAPCRTCAGQGYLADPIEEIPCPFCKASAWHPCGQCNGFGKFGVNDGSGGSNEVKCGACKKKGRYACTVCDGTRRLATIRFKKKSPSEAKLKDLIKAREVLQACLKELEPWEPKGSASKSQKALEKMLAKPAKTFPALKEMLELLDTALGGLRKAAAQYQGYEAKLDFQLLTFRNRMIYTCRYNVRVLDLCIERAKHNENIK